MIAGVRVAFMGLAARGAVRRAVVGLVLAPLALAAIVGCRSGLRPAGTATEGRLPDIDGLGPESALAFAPAAVRLYPLTHLQRDEAGAGRIVCYLEVKDGWGDGLKALGTLQVQLYRPMRDGSLVRESVWDVDLRSPQVNVALFDPVTRAYRVQLGGVPAWVEPMIDRAESREQGSAAEGLERLVLRAVFTTIGEDGEPVVLRDDLVVEQ